MSERLSHPFRLLQDSPLPGVENMARDESLLQSAAGGDQTSTLRLYEWSAPTVSLGYFQPYSEFERLPPSINELDVVRRLTGGGAILHDRELTYSLTLPIGHPLVGRAPNHLYEMVHDAIADGLGELGIETNRHGTSDDSGPARGPFFCFARRHRYDLMLGSDKIAGSAQRRTRDAILQHGSIIVANRFTEQPAAQVTVPFSEMIDQLRKSLPRQLASVFQVELVPGSWRPDELAESARLVGKYAGKEWTARV